MIRRSYLVLYRVDGMYPFQTPLSETFQAGSEMEARVFCLMENPGAEILWVTVDTNRKVA